MMYWGYPTKTQLFGGSNSSSKLSLDIISEKKPIHVVVRLKPQANEGNKLLPYFCTPSDKQVVGLDVTKKQFSKFDHIFDTACTQEDIFKYLNEGLHITENVMNAYNNTIITYGQSQMGKSYTLQGNSDNKERESGIIYKIAQDLFLKLNKEQEENDTKFIINLKALEINVDKIYDILSEKDSTKKSLKLHHESNKVEYSIKDWSSLPTSTIYELNSALDKIFNSRRAATSKGLRSKTHLFIKFVIEQRNSREEVLKLSSLNFIDLAGSDLVVKNSRNDVSSEEAKKMNNEMKAFKHVIDTIASYNPKQNEPIPDGTIPYRESTLTKILLDFLTGNSLTTIILCCSTDRKDENQSIETLDMGLKFKKIWTSVNSNKHGLHQKKKMTLLMDNMKLKEANYVLRIDQLEQERDSLRSKFYNNEKDEKTRETENVSAQLKKAESENAALMEQIEILRNLLKKPSDDQNCEFNPDSSIVTITNILIKKSSKVVELQSTLEETKHGNYVLQEKLKQFDEKDRNLEHLNSKLVKQIQVHEETLNGLLTSNATIQSELDNNKDINKIRNEKIRILEEKMHSGQNSSTEHLAYYPRKGSISTSSGQTVIPTYEDESRTSWGFPANKGNLWGTRKTSTNSIGALASASEETFVPRPLKKGLNLNSVRVFSNSDTHGVLPKNDE